MYIYCVKDVYKLNTINIRVDTADVKKMRTSVKELLIKNFPELKDISLSDKVLFKKTVEWALK